MPIMRGAAMCVYWAVYGNMTVAKIKRQTLSLPFVINDDLLCRYFVFA